MIKYSIFYHPDIFKKLQKLQPSTRQKILNILELIEKNPRERGLNAKKIPRSKNTYRVRIGNVRVIFGISIKERKVYVWNFTIRGNIY